MNNEVKFLHPLEEAATEAEGDWGKTVIELCESAAVRRGLAVLGRKAVVVNAPFQKFYFLIKNKKYTLAQVVAAGSAAEK